MADRIETLFDGAVTIPSERILSPPIATAGFRAIVLFGTATSGDFSTLSFFTFEPTLEHQSGVPTVPNFLCGPVNVTGPLLTYRPHPDPTIVFPTVAPPLPVLGPFFRCSASCLTEGNCGQLTLRALLME